MPDREPVLCYVDRPWAYFTTQELEKQWGDDWNDAPYEHNAETPYVYAEHDRVAGRERWRIVKLAFDAADLHTPDYMLTNSEHSVQDINAKAVPWLQDHYGDHCVSIYAGATVGEFIAAVEGVGGEVYEKRGECLS